MVQIDMAQIGVVVSIITGIAVQLTLHPVHVVRQRALQDMHLMITRVVTIWLSCLASYAHCDSSTRCKDDVTGAGIVAEAQNTLELQHNRSFPCRNQASHGSDGMTQVHVTQTDGMVSIIDGVAGTTPHPVHNFASTYLRVR